MPAISRRCRASRSTAIIRTRGSCPFSPRAPPPRCGTASGASTWFDGGVVPPGHVTTAIFPIIASASEAIQQAQDEALDCFVAFAPRKDGLDGPRTASMCQNEVDEDLKQRGPSMNEISTIGLDLAKNVFQIHGVDASGAVVLRRQLRRGAVEKLFAQLPPCLVGMEACGSAHHWARVIGSYGHQVRLMPPAYVKAYIKRNKNDGRDAEAICEAVTRPTMRFVPVKSVQQQAT